VPGFRRNDGEFIVKSISLGYNDEKMYSNHNKTAIKYFNDCLFIESQIALQGLRTLTVSLWMPDQSGHDKVDLFQRLLNNAFFILISLMVLFLILPVQVRAEGSEVFETSEVIVLFDPGIGEGAQNLADIYSQIKIKTQELFGWTYDKKPLIVLINNRNRFLQTTDHPITIAYAVPNRNLIVIDYSRVVTTPFSLETTLTHEFCHLLLHDHIPNIPRWLDEGLCQWASGGIDEIIYNFRQSQLNQASITGNFIPFKNLDSGFPRSDQARVLAYEQSKSFINYLVRHFGEDKLLELLDRMTHGEVVDEAFNNVYQIQFNQMELSWKKSLRKDLAWFTYLSNHLYEILFVASALLTIIGFVKLIRKKHNYKDDDFDDNQL
jgi:hypothetical protein